MVACGLKLTRWSIRRAERRMARYQTRQYVAGLERALSDWKTVDAERAMAAAAVAKVLNGSLAAEPRG